MDPGNVISLANMGFLSPDSRCFSFDSRANGYAKGEGVGVVLLQRFADAVRDGNPIRAVIRATSTNSNGNNAGITQPSQRTQEELIIRTYEKAGLTVDDTKASLRCWKTQRNSSSKLSQLMKCIVRRRTWYWYRYRRCC
jgi:acyl transferase domain-containing protein